MSLYEPVEGDTFLRVRDDGNFGGMPPSETLTFSHDNNGRVVSGQYYNYAFRRAQR